MAMTELPSVDLPDPKLLAGPVAVDSETTGLAVDDGAYLTVVSVAYRREDDPGAIHHHAFPFDVGRAEAKGFSVVRFPDTLTRMHAASKPQVLGLLLVLIGAALRLRGQADVGMLILAGMFTLITAPVVANRVGQLAYREQSFRDDLLIRDELDEYGPY